MPICTLLQVKTLLQTPLTDVTLDPLIEALLPVAQDKIVTYCNHRFVEPGVQVHGTDIACVPAVAQPAADAMLTAAADFALIGFYAGCEVKLHGTLRNDGYYIAKAAANGSLSLTTDLVAEAAGPFVQVARVAWPPALRLPFSILVRYMMERSGKLTSSETLPGGYTVAHKSEADIMLLFNQWRRPL
jgi:hypothetical protein